MLENQKTPEQAPTPLVAWKNPPSLQNLKQDYEDAKPSHDAHMLNVSRWLANLNLTSAVSKPEKAPTQGSKVAPKLIRKQAEWRYPALSDPFLSSPDIFNVRPVSWEDKTAAEQNQLILNNQFNTKIDRVRFIDDFVRTAVDEGTAIVRVGWEFEEETYEGEVPVVRYLTDPAAAQLHSELAQMKQESPSAYELDVPDELKTAHEMTIEGGIPIRPEVTGYERKKLTRTIKNHPTVDVCNTKNVIIDPSCGGDISKAGFVIYSFESSKAKLQKDKRYKNLDQIALGASSPLNQPDHDSQGTGNFNFKDQPRQLFVVHEYWGFWDIEGDGVLKPIVAAWVGNVMIRLEENPFPDKAIPFVTVSYLPKRREIYGEPDGELLEDNQKIIGAVTRGMIDILGKSANGQTGIRKDMLDVTNRRKYENGQDYEFNPSVDPRQAVHMHTYPEIPASAQFMLQMQQFEAESLTGVKAFTNGIGSQSLGDVAAGIRGALDAASKRELSILRRFTEAIIKIGRKIVAMNQAFLSEKEVIRVTNEEFVAVRRDDLGGSFDLALTISTAEEDNNKAQELAFMYQTSAPNGDRGLNKMLLAEIAKLRKMPDLAKQIMAYEPQPDPLAVRKAELEIQLLEAQIANEHAQAQERMASAQLGGARAGTEQAKTDNLNADTDKKNLEFVEQESGVNQERQVQLESVKGNQKAALQQQAHASNMEKAQVDLLREYMKTRLKQKAA